MQTTDETNGICTVCGKQFKFKKAGNRYYKTDFCTNKCRSRAWYLKNRDEMRARSKERYWADPESKRKSSRTYQKMLREKALKLFGGDCYICEKKARQKNTSLPDFHEKSGKTHSVNGFKLALENPDDFVPLCPGCHRGVHFAMKYLGMTWNEIEERLIEVKRNT